MIDLPGEDFPSIDTPVKLSYSVIDLAQMDPSLVKVQLEVENPLHLLPDENKNILIIKDEGKIF